MAACTTCTASLGIVTVIVDNRVTTVECPECQGVGYTCNRCGKGFDDCRCLPEPTGVQYVENGQTTIIRNPYLNFYALQAEVNKRLGPGTCKLLFD